jgi:hypothetical protein
VLAKLGGIEDMMYEMLTTQRVMLGRLDALERGVGTPASGKGSARKRAIGPRESSVSQRWSAMDFVPDFLRPGSSNDERSRGYTSDEDSSYR